MNLDMQQRFYAESHYSRYLLLILVLTWKLWQCSCLLLHTVMSTDTIYNFTFTSKYINKRVTCFHGGTDHAYPRAAVVSSSELASHRFQSIHKVMSHQCLQQVSAVHKKVVLWVLLLVSSRTFVLSRVLSVCLLAQVKLLSQWYLGL